ncbi:serine hydroxymethyltransferase [Candidatus Altiarchaeales archaeon WOR_SM1_SCG]|nr:serine hydroxymethyltransferase [Candidatus Altiarchaeales archaeon WOR_SM1_SCG]
MSYIRKIDPEIADAIQNDINRQEYNLQLIASENYASRAVLEAQGCVMTNKYAEGYPHKRYYGGCEFVDIAEDLAIERAKKLFNAEHANVQPNAGSSANMGVYFSVIKPGDKIMGMALDHGGHLTHGARVSFSGKEYHSVQYGVNRETQKMDYAEISAIAKKEKPDMIICGASAYPGKIDFKIFGEIADDCGAYLTADVAHIAGLIAGGVHESSVPYADFTTTTTHKTLRGPRGGMVLCKEEHAKTVDRTIFPGIQGGPFMHVIAAKAVCFKEAMTQEFKEYAGQIVKNAKTIASELINNDFNIVSGGTDNHLMLVDLRSKDITGKEADAALQNSGIILNKNTIPFETQSPFVTSGIRIGTPSVTTRGMKENEMKQIADMITRVLSDINNEKVHEEVRKEVKELCSGFPVYADMEV